MVAWFHVHTLKSFKNIMQLYINANNAEVSLVLLALTEIQGTVWYSNAHYTEPLKTGPRLNSLCVPCV